MLVLRSQHSQIGVRMRGCLYGQVQLLAQLGRSGSLLRLAESASIAASSKSIDELKHATMDYLDNHNGRPKPYVGTKTAVEIFQ